MDGAHPELWSRRGPADVASADPLRARVQPPLPRVTPTPSQQFAG